MPRGDRTGPEGKGSKTGRQMGLCSGYDKPGFENSSETTERGGLGLGRGQGQGRRGNGPRDGRGAGRGNGRNSSK
ncbi:MAG: DUF5320 domain-containing protein [Mycoplasmataceae bacterium]|nr:DUF5320 domain-containing protein [Mycoplasmataceae bacterium]